MNNHMVFNDVDEVTKATLEAYWLKKLPKLQKLLVPYKTDLQDVRLTVSLHRQNQRSWYDVGSVIHLPTGTLAATDNDKDPHAALDRVLNRIVGELKRHKEHVRQDHLFRRKGRPRPTGERSGRCRRRPVSDRSPWE
jgi:ribosomal subunit interface protein